MSLRILRVGLYARVSSQRQAEEKTIESQLQAIKDCIVADGLVIDPRFEFYDDGYSGSELVRPALERLRDIASAGGMDRLYIHSPDRLSRKLAHQALLLEEFSKASCEVVFLNQRGMEITPEVNLLTQVQGMIAEYERAKILERTRRGRKYAALHGKVSVFSNAPYGYRYIDKTQGDGVARWEIDPITSAHIRTIFQWVGIEGCSLREVVRRLFANSIVSATGKARWDSSTLRGMLRNPAYYGQAEYGKNQLLPRKTRQRARRGAPAVPRQAKVSRTREYGESITVAVPAIIDKELFDKVRTKMEENRKRQREHQQGAKYLLSGLLVCGECGSAYCARSHRGGYVYYRCIGTDKSRHFGQTICQATALKESALEALVWDEVCQLLQDPKRMQTELERRQAPANSSRAEVDKLERSTKQLKLRIERLIDAFESGLIELDEFERRIGPLRERYKRDAAAMQSLRGECERSSEIIQATELFEEFSSKVASHLAGADWDLKRDLFKILIDRIEVLAEQIRIVYKVPSGPFVRSLASNASRGVLQDWLWRHNPCRAGRARFPPPPCPQGRRPDTSVLRSSAGIAVIIRIPLRVLVRARRRSTRVQHSFHCRRDHRVGVPLR